jgi:hypothetical protein
MVILETKKGRELPDLQLMARRPTKFTVKDRKRYSCGLQVLGRALAFALIRNDVESQLLTFHEGPHSSTLDGGNVDKYVGLTVALLNKAKAFGGVEKLYCSGGHEVSFQIGVQCRAWPNAKRRIGRY